VEQAVQDFDSLYGLLHALHRGRVLTFCGFAGEARPSRSERRSRHLSTMSSDDVKRLIERQVRSLNQLHNKVIAECYAKCVAGGAGTTVSGPVRPKEPDLAIGEMACVDRCVPKYLEAHELVGKELETFRQGRAADFP
jgi:NAD-dependent dihydropyrimidine dehydrogenase PreA subunit